MQIFIRKSYVSNSAEKATFQVGFELLFLAAEFQTESLVTQWTVLDHLVRFLYGSTVGYVWISVNWSCMSKSKRKRTPFIWWSDSSYLKIFSKIWKFDFSTYFAWWSTTTRASLFLMSPVYLVCSVSFSFYLSVNIESLHIKHDFTSALVNIILK